jgi:exodeoxyribonuclease VIII
MTTEIIRNLPMREYLQLRGTSASGIKQFLRSPAHYKYWQTAPSEPTPAQRLGTLVHTMVLEPDSFLDRYTIAPVVDRRTKAGKEQYDEWVATLNGREPVTLDQYDTAQHVARSVRSQPMWASLLIVAEDVEVTAVGDIDGHRCKGRADIVAGRTLVDLKTAANASPQAFARSMATYGYHIQAALYCDLFGADRFILVAVETAAPYACGIYTVDDASLEQGRIEYQRALAGIRECRATDNWPSYGAQEIALPGWAFDYDDEVIV